MNYTNESIANSSTSQFESILITEQAIKKSAHLSYSMNLILKNKVIHLNFVSYID